MKPQIYRACKYSGALGWWVSWKDTDVKVPSWTAAITYALHWVGKHKQ